MPLLCRAKGVVVSDLHIGGGGPADDYEPHEQTFLRLANYCLTHNYHLIINGDLFEFWQFHADEILKAHPDTFAALERLQLDGKLCLIVGNHDAELGVFAGIFRGVVFSSLEIDTGALHLWIEHGHRFDRVNAKPGWFPRTLSWLAGKLERANRQADNISRYSPVRDGFRGDPYYDAASAILREANFDAVVLGHTHGACEEVIATPKGAKRYLNSGSWTGQKPNAILFDTGYIKLVPNVRNRSNPL